MISVFGFIGVLFTIIGFFALAAGRNAERLRLHGIRGQARVLALLPTSIKINNMPLLKLQVSIELPGQAPYNAESKVVLNGMLLSRAVPGAAIAVRVDPQRPNKFILELD